MFGLPQETLEKINSCLKKHSEIHWVKVYGSRAKGDYRPSSDIDICFSSNRDISAKLLAELEELPTPYLFDVTHYESIQNPDLKLHIDRVGKLFHYP